ncbi:hypothetical protein EG68_04997 [Paragonimus skrjabini miyazakii]|uniref:Uncharacterized protein n=1 Tax=Paragonimus skrjabini miyazakii TaxID=59628 RepID=A0A8S9YSG0_9TREM|nr:hypothetical protein EG68_04997 [Paragonimus skrjabini miyazakii]
MYRHIFRFLKEKKSDAEYIKVITALDSDDRITEIHVPKLQVRRSETFRRQTIHMDSEDKWMKIWFALSTSCMGRNQCTNPNNHIVH